MVGFVLTMRLKIIFEGLVKCEQIGVIFIVDGLSFVRGDKLLESRFFL
jgi:hypothetical protein